MTATSFGPHATLLEAVSTADAQSAGIADGCLDDSPAETPSDAPRASRFVLFTIGATRFGVPEALVTELDRVPKITPVPQVPLWVRGVTNLRGDVLSVVDLRLFLNLEPAIVHHGRLIVVRLLDEEFSVGLLVDTIDRIVTVNDAEIRPPAGPLEGAVATFLRGICTVADQPVAVLDLARLLHSPDIRQFDEAKEDSSCEVH